jgi:hypothetical protein
MDCPSTWYEQPSRVGEISWTSLYSGPIGETGAGVGKKAVLFRLLKKSEASYQKLSYLQFHGQRVSPGEAAV